MRVDMIMQRDAPAPSAGEGNEHAGDNTPIMPRAHVLTTTPGDTSAQAQPNLAGT
jgi:hypothetical protein